MVADDSESLLSEFGLENRGPPEFFRSQDEVKAAALNGYAHILRRAWRNFDGLVGVLSVRGRPTVYVQQRDADGRITVGEQRRFWSNGIAPLLIRATPSEIQVYSALRSPALVPEEVDSDE